MEKLIEKKLKYFFEKSKDFLKKHSTLYTIVFFVWGAWRLVRTKFIFQKIEHKPIDEKKPKIVILAVRAFPTTNLVYFDAVFGHAFRKLGCETKMLYCGGLLDSCDADTIIRNQKSQCFLCKNLGPLARKALNLDCVSFKQYITDSDIKKIKNEVASLKIKELINYKYLGVEVGNQAKSSAIRYFLKGKLDLNEQGQAKMLRKKLIYAMIMAKIAENLYLKEKPKIIFMLHGIYSTWGAFADYFRSKNIDVVIYANETFDFGNFVFIRNSKEFELISRNTWEKFKKMPLTENEEFQVDAYLGKRFEGLVGDQLLYSKNFDNNLRKKSLLQTLYKNYSRGYVFYSSLAWDACLEGRGSTIFRDIFDCLDATIEYFKNKPQYQLIIKPHPAELVWEKSTESIVRYIADKYPKLPENITVLRPDTPLNAYDLIKKNIIGITFSGSIGWELATQGAPVLVAGNTHYIDAGAVYKIKSLKEYFALFDNPGKLISFAKNNVKLAKKYAYFYLFKLPIRVPFYRDDKWALIDWKKLKKTEKILDENSNIIKICKKIIEGEDVIAPL